MISALVPIKENSQRVPNKNIRDLGGKPLFYWILDMLYSIDSINEVAVNTDSDLIEKEIKNFFPEIKIIFREESVRGDQVSMNKIIGSSLEYLENELVLQTHTTSPFLTRETLLKGLDLAIKEKKGVFSVTKLHERIFDKDLNPVNHDVDKLIQTQDLDPYFIENSGFYIFYKKDFDIKKSRISKDSLICETSGYESLDIDTEEDFRIAEIIKLGLSSDE